MSNNEFSWRFDSDIISDDPVSQIDGVVENDRYTVFVMSEVIGPKLTGWMAEQLEIELPLYIYLHK